MHGQYRIGMMAWAVSVGVFGWVLALGAFHSSSWLLEWAFQFLKPEAPIEFNPHMRFFCAVMGPLTLGWSVTLVGIIKISDQLAPAQQRQLWGWTTLGVFTWFFLDSSLSVITGFWRNVIPNTFYALTYLLLLLKSGVMNTPKVQGVPLQHPHP